MIDRESIEIRQFSTSLTVDRKQKVTNKHEEK